jgi:excisionase family DNA binding protein
LLVLDQLERELRAIRQEIEGISKRLKSQAFEAQAYSLQQAAQALSCSPRHVARLISSGELVCVRVGRLRRIPRTELERLLEAKAPTTAQKIRGARFTPRQQLERLHELRRRR